MSNGEGNPSFTVRYSGFVFGQDSGALGGTLAFSTTATASSHVGSYSVTPNGLTSSNYAISYHDGTLDIGKRNVTASISAADKTYNGNNNATITGCSLEAQTEVDLVLFPVTNPSVFDAVVTEDDGRVARVDVKRPDAGSCWVWGAVTTSGRAFTALRWLWESRHRADEYLGHLLNAYIGAGNPVHASYCGESYLDVGTVQGYHTAQDFLRARRAVPTEEQPA